MRLKKRYIIILSILLIVVYNKCSNDILVAFDKKFNNYRENRIDRKIDVSFEPSAYSKDDIDSLAVYEVEDPLAVPEYMIPYKRNMYPFCSYQKSDSTLILYFGKSEKTSSAYIIAGKNGNAHFSWASESNKQYTIFRYKEKPFRLKKADIEMDTLHENFILIDADIELESTMYYESDYYETKPISHSVRLNQCLKCLPSENTVATIIDNEEKYLRVNENVIDKPKARLEAIKKRLSPQ